MTLGIGRDNFYGPSIDMRWIILLLMGIALAVFMLSGCSRKVSIPPGTIVFLGDSITAGYGLEPDQAYPTLIEIKGMTMLNLGVSGSKTEDGLQRLKDFFNAGGNPQLVVIALGANDILQGVAPDMMEANLEYAVLECKSHGVPVMLCGIRIPGKFGTDGIFEKVADDGHVPLLRDLMQGEQTQEALLQEDHMHPTAAGQKIIAQKMQAALLKSFSSLARGAKISGKKLRLLRACPLFSRWFRSGMARGCSHWHNSTGSDCCSWGTLGRFFPCRRAIGSGFCGTRRSAPLLRLMALSVKNRAPSIMPSSPKWPMAG